jgi:hypothetical protein
MTRKDVVNSSFGPSSWPRPIRLLDELEDDVPVIQKQKSEEKEQAGVAAAAGSEPKKQTGENEGAIEQEIKKGARLEKDKLEDFWSRYETC